MTIDQNSNDNRSGSRPTRVFVVDDSVVIRGLVSRWLRETGRFDVVGTAANGRIAVENIERFDPEIVLLDIEMPEMDGVTALPLLLQRKPDLKVIVVSTLTQRNAEFSVRCLSLGAVDYLPKPESRNLGTSDDFRQELIERLSVHAQSTDRATDPVGRPSRAHRIRRSIPARPRVLLIGASTGGPRAIEQVLLGLGPALKRIPVLVVQHMPPMFTAVFASHLRMKYGIDAREGAEGDSPVPGTVLIAPGGRHMGVTGQATSPVIRLDDGPPMSFCRPAVDFLFRDAAAVFGNAAIATVLTGMGSDGTMGTRLLVEAGATVIVQDEATSTVWGMPGSIAKAGLAHEVLPLEAIGPTIASIIGGAV